MFSHNNLRFLSITTTTSSSSSRLVFSKQLPISTLVARAQTLLLSSSSSSSTSTSESSSSSSSSSTTTAVNSFQTMIQAKKCLHEVFEETKSQRLKILISSLDEAIALQKIREESKRNNNNNYSDQEEDNITSASSAPLRSVSKTNNNNRYFQSVIPIATLSSNNPTSPSSLLSIEAQEREFQSHLDRGFFVQTSASKNENKNIDSSRSHLDVWNRIAEKQSNKNNKQVTQFGDFIMNHCEQQPKRQFKNQSEMCLFASSVLFLNELIDVNDQTMMNHNSNTLLRESNVTLSKNSITLENLSMEDVFGKSSSSSSPSILIIFKYCCSIIKRCIQQEKRSAPLLGLMKTTTSLLYKIISLHHNNNSNNNNDEEFESLLRDFAPFLSILVAMFSTSIFPIQVVSSCVLDVDFLLSSSSSTINISGKNNKNNHRNSWIIRHIVEEISAATLDDSSSSISSSEIEEINNNNHSRQHLPTCTVHERLLEALLKQAMMQSDTSATTTSSTICWLSKISSHDLSIVFDSVIHSLQNDHSSSNLKRLIFGEPNVCQTVAQVHPTWSLWIDTIAPSVFANDIKGYRIFLSSLDSKSLEPYQRRLVALVGVNNNNTNSNNNSSSPSPSSWRQSLLLYSAVSGSTYSSESQSVFYNPALKKRNSNSSNKLMNPNNNNNAHFIRQLAAVKTIESLHGLISTCSSSSSSNLLDSLPSHVPIRLARSLMMMNTNSYQQKEHSDDDRRRSKNSVGAPPALSLPSTTTTTSLSPEAATQLIRISCVNGEWNSALQLHESFSKYFNDREVEAKKYAKEKNKSNSLSASSKKERSSSTQQQQQHWFEQEPNNKSSLITEEEDDDDFGKTREIVRNLNSDGRNSLKKLLHSRPLQRKDAIEENSSQQTSEITKIIQQERDKVFNDPQYKSIVTSVADYSSRTTQIATKVSSVARHSLGANWAGVLSSFPSSASDDVVVDELVHFIRKKHVTTSVAYACLATGQWQRAFKILGASSPSSQQVERTAAFTSSSPLLLSQPQQWVFAAKKYSNAPLSQIQSLKDAFVSSRNHRRHQGEAFVTGMSDDFDVHEEEFVKNDNIGQLKKKSTTTTKTTTITSMRRLRSKLDAMELQEQKEQQKKNKSSSSTSSSIDYQNNNNKLPTKITAKLHSMRRTTTLIRASTTNHNMVSSSEMTTTITSSSASETSSRGDYFEALRNVYRPSGEAFAQTLNSIRNNATDEKRRSSSYIKNRNSSSTAASNATSSWEDAIELFQDAYLASGKDQMRPDIYLGTLEHVLSFDSSNNTNAKTSSNNKTNDDLVIIGSEKHHLEASSTTTTYSSSSAPPPEIIKSLVNVTKHSPAFQIDARVSTALIRTAAAAHLWSDVIDCFFILLDTSRTSQVPDRTSVAVVLTACKEIDGKCDKMLSEVKAYLETTLEDQFALLGDALQHVKWFRGKHSTIVTMEVRASEYGKVQNNIGTAFSDDTRSSNSISSSSPLSSSASRQEKRMMMTKGAKRSYSDLNETFRLNH